MILNCLYKVIFFLQVIGKRTKKISFDDQIINVLREYLELLPHSCRFFQDQLIGLVLLNIYDEMQIKIETILSRFAMAHPGRMKMVDMIDQD